MPETHKPNVVLLMDSRYLTSLISHHFTQKFNSMFLLLHLDTLGVSCSGLKEVGFMHKWLAKQAKQAKCGHSSSLRGRFFLSVLFVDTSSFLIHGDFSSPSSSLPPCLSRFKCQCARPENIGTHTQVSLRIFSKAPQAYGSRKFR